jgi:multiple sugar transport system substrate-binding protein
MPGLSRRQLLAATGGTALAGALAACGSPVATSFTGGQPSTADVIFWHLFGGGDGANMATMIKEVQRPVRRGHAAVLG